jgi:hypothetical protein
MYEYVAHPVGLTDARRNAPLSERPRRRECHDRKAGCYSARNNPAPSPFAVAYLQALLLEPGKAARCIRLPIARWTQRRQTFLYPMIAFIVVHIA